RREELRVAREWRRHVEVRALHVAVPAGVVRCRERRARDQHLEKNCGEDQFAHDRLYSPKRTRNSTSLCLVVDSESEQTTVIRYICPPSVAARVRFTMSVTPTLPVETPVAAATLWTAKVS